LLPTITALKDRLPQVKTVVVFESKTDEKKVVYLKQDEVTFVPFRLVEAKGFESKVSLKTVDPDDIAVIMYTSGSTGEPKGVMLTHANLVSSLMACCALACNLMGHGRNQAEAYLAYLPLAHIFELTHEIIVLSLGIKVGYSSPATLTDASIAIMPGHKGDINILRPSVMPAVPVILDRIYKSLRAKINQKGELFGRIFDYFVGYRTWWVRRDYDTPILNKLLFGKIQASLGGQLKVHFFFFFFLKIVKIVLLLSRLSLPEEHPCPVMYMTF
jgi:long-chain acyl-CoA synthetase